MMLDYIFQIIFLAACSKIHRLNQGAIIYGRVILIVLKSISFQHYTIGKYVAT